ncbi:MAG: hypothetical protein JXA78_04580 [Anaerolineales bacterium]|nr:hypothetical protein [Anaerolineales bacterium]
MSKPPGIAPLRPNVRSALVSIALLLVGIACSLQAIPAVAPEAAETTLVVTVAAEQPVEKPIEQPLSTPTALLALPTPQAALPTAAPVQPAIPEQRLLILEWPLKVRLGDAELIRLSLVMDEAGKLTPTAYVEGGELRMEPVEIPNLYDTHNVVAEARLDLAGVEHRPSGEVSEALLPGRPVSFVWSVRPAEIGRYRGTVWLHLRFIPRGAGEQSSMALTAQLIEIEAVNFLGLGGSAARLVGGLGVVVGSLLGLDNLLSGLLKLFQMRKTAKR